MNTTPGFERSPHPACGGPPWSRTALTSLVADVSELVRRYAGWRAERKDREAPPAQGVCRNTLGGTAVGAEAGSPSASLRRVPD